VKNYSINQSHPLFQSLRAIILQFVGLDQIIENILKKVGNLEQVFLTGDLAEGKNTSFIDLVLVGDVDKTYLYQLIEKIEPLIHKKIRVALISPLEYSLGMLDDVDKKMQLL
jgi:predicted nucleotidyltransferase